MITLYKTDGNILGEFDHQSVDSDPLNIKKATAVLTAIENQIEIKSANLSKCNWHNNLEFESIDFSGCDFSFSIMNDAKFKNCKFISSLFYKSSFENCVFEDCIFDNSVFHFTSLKVSDLGKIKFGLSEFYETNLIGCKWENGEIKTQPFFISGTDYPIIIIDNYISIGCETRTIEEWEGHDTRDLIKLDNKKAGNFWNTWKDDIISISKKLSGYNQVNNIKESANIASIVSTTTGGLNVLA